MKPKFLAIFLAVTLLVVMVDCSKNGTISQISLEPVVNAQAGCGPEVFALGTVRPDNSTVLETADALEFASPVCPDDRQWHMSSYTLQYAHQVQTAMLESGSYPGVVQEMAVWVEFHTPDGHDVYLTHQYDKHQDMQGNRFDVYPFRVNLPVGTVVIIKAPPVACLQRTQSYPCANAHKLSLIGTF
jgi:hypothetical protein